MGEECAACGVACGGGAGGGALAYVGHGQGEYIQETTYEYVGCGGDFDVVRPRRDFTCVICLGGSLLLLIPLLCWLLSGSSPPYDCEAGLGSIENSWSQAQKDYCCATVGRGCATTALPGTTVTVPPTPFSHTAAHSTAHAAGHATGDSGPDPAHSSAWTSGPIQLRRRGAHVLGLCQADLVLRSPPHLWSADRATAPSRPIQLSGWIRE